MGDNQAHFSHDIYKNDPILLKSILNKNASIKTRDGRIHDGIVYTVDPVSESIILLNPTTEDMKMKIIMGHAIEGMEISGEDETDIPELFLSTRKNLSESVIIRRKNAVKELLLKNRFPVTENDDILNIQDILSIEPPYDQEHCISNNEIVLLRIQELISGIEI